MLSSAITWLIFPAINEVYNSINAFFGQRFLESQKVPALLDEVHWLIENTDIKIIMCGSSTRKVKRDQANLLGGRAMYYEIFGLTGHELAEIFVLHRLRHHGYLPKTYRSKSPRVDFLEIATLCDTYRGWLQWLFCCSKV